MKPEEFVATLPSRAQRVEFCDRVFALQSVAKSIWSFNANVASASAPATERPEAIAATCPYRLPPGKARYIPGVCVTFQRFTRRAALGFLSLHLRHKHVGAGLAEAPIHLLEREQHHGQ